MKLITENELIAFKYDMMLWAPYENKVKMNIYIGQS